MQLFPTRTRAACFWIVAGVALMPLAVSAGSEIHRCIDEGRVTYTDRGCAAQDEAGVIPAMTPVSTNVSEVVAPQERETPVTLGMSPRMVFAAMGRPLETVATLHGRTLVEYWLYRSADGTTRVAFQEGRVTSIRAR